MVDIPAQVAHWRQDAEEDWAAASLLIDRAHIRQGLFFAHLSIEKALKALVCRRTQDVPPRTHNLVRLAEFAQLELTPGRLDVLADLNRFSMVGRYPDIGDRPGLPADVTGYLARAREVLQWLMTQS